MTKEEAGTLIKALILAYPTQARSKEFLALMGAALTRSGLSPRTVALRIDVWIRTERFWPAISDLVAPADETPSPIKRLSGTAGALPGPEAVALLRQLTIERPQQ